MFDINCFIFEYCMICLYWIVFVLLLFFCNIFVEHIINAVVSSYKFEQIFMWIRKKKFKKNDSMALFYYTYDTYLKQVFAL